ncbi:cytochrome P450 90B1-like [Ananas comosus]|uniref:Cytochrome P450 90B1-like n=1 Tax=Ananas comosus TaxID=4615 RepID=A0A6P5FGV4_ANACO|nr:cytochrome P450 90B1-like [Ananas comosus]
MHLFMALPLLLLVSFLAILALNIFIVRCSHWNAAAHCGRPLRLPPGSSGWPLVGETVSFMRPHSSASLGDFIDRRIAKYGKIFRTSLLGKATVVSADAEFNRWVLQAEGQGLFAGSCPTSIAEIMGRQSMLALVGDAHREMRSIAVAFLGGGTSGGLRRRSRFFATVERQAAKVLDSWNDRVCHGSVGAAASFSAHKEAKNFTFSVMVKHLISMEEETAEAKQLSKEYATFMRGMASLPLNLPGMAHRKARKSRAKILSLIGQKLDERIKQKLQEKKLLKEAEKADKAEAEKAAEEEEEGGGDLLDLVLKHQNLTREQILDLVLSMLFAGHETSSAAIALAIYFLQSSPKAVQQLREEHTRIAKLRIVDEVIAETLRLGNIVKFLHRRAIKNVQYKGYDIPCGWELVPIISAEHLDPSIYDDPQSYNPWRWQTLPVKSGNSLMSFGCGPRLCPGAEFGKLEMAVFLHHLVQRFHWELAEHDFPVSLPFLGFPKGLPIKIRPIGP